MYRCEWERLPAGKAEITGEMLKGGGVVSEDWIPEVIVPLYKGKGEMIQCKNYIDIILLTVSYVFSGSIKLTYNLRFFIVLSHISALG